MQELTGIETDEVSPVRRAANLRRFLLRKNADDTSLSPELVDVLSQPHESEGALTDLLRKGGASETSIEAAVAAVRLLKGFEDELPEALRANLDGVLKADKSPMDHAEGCDGDDCDGDCVGMSKEDVEKRNFTAAERRAAASSGAAEGNGSFPIENEKDLKNAIDDIGRTKDRSAAMAHIKTRAKELGLTELLPDSWGDGNVNKEGHDMSEGTVSVSVPVKKEDGSWDLSGVAPEARPFYEDVLKARDEAEEAAKTLTERVEKAETAAAESQDKLRTVEHVQKAESFSHVAPVDELAPVLKEAQEKLTPETFEKLEGIFKAVEERIVKGDLFTEFGKRTDGSESAGDAMAQLEKMADELVEKSTGDEPLSKEQAFDRVLATEKGAALYAQYKGERTGAVS